MELQSRSKHRLNFSSNNIKTITINHFSMEESLVYMKLSEASLIHIKGTTLYTKKEHYKTNSRMGKINEHLQ